MMVNGGRERKRTAHHEEKGKLVRAMPEKDLLLDCCKKGQTCDDAKASAMAVDKSGFAGPFWAPTPRRSNASDITIAQNYKVRRITIG